MFSQQSLSPLSLAITCAILQPALRSLLIFDAPFTGLQQIADQITHTAAQTGQRLKPIFLNSNEHDEDLWGLGILPGRHGKIETYARIFSPSYGSEEIPLLIIPDLSALSLAAARSCIMLVDAPVAHLERHGQQGIWSPRYYWLACCRQELVGAVSPHLLDRFALRLSWKSDEDIELSRQDRVKIIQSIIQQRQPNIPQFNTIALQAIKHATQYPPNVRVTPEACDLITTYQRGEVFHQRRELTLARCSLALAQLAGDTLLLESHVEQAANLMGLQKQKIQENLTITPQAEPSDPSSVDVENELYMAPTRQATTDSTTLPEPSMTKRHIEVQTQEPKEQPAISYVITPTNPYPEDTEPILREAGSLQMPHQHFIKVRSDRGPIIGVEPSTTLHDLALVNTLLHALLFQAFRPKQDLTKIVLEWTDLMKYRRAALPVRLLLLLLDYTSLSLTQRQQALIPYLRQAYIERAGIAIIKVGAATSPKRNELQAEIVSARNILVPVISEAIDAPAGSATPLAHGLELALQFIKRTLQHGRSTVQQITLVVISDGRGNVPLKVSHGKTIMLPVAREGFDDALEQAHEIGEIKHINSAVISPQLRYYQTLPVRLSDALNASLIILENEEEV